jgi:P-type Cu+ transporter
VVQRKQVQIQRGLNGFISEDELLRLAASVEKGSEHPLGEAILAEANERGLALGQPQASKPR